MATEEKGKKTPRLAEIEPAGGGENGGGNGELPPRVVVELDRAVPDAVTDHRYFWSRIRQGTTQIGFTVYEQFIDAILCEGEFPTTYPEIGERLKPVREPLTKHVAGVAAYQVLKTATEVFLLMNCGLVLPDRLKSEFFGRSFLPDREMNPIREQRRREESERLGESTTTAQTIIAGLTRLLGSRLDSLLVLPYFRRVIENSFSKGELGSKSPFCEGILDSRIDAMSAPCLLELIWSYWHEEAMLVQAINMIALRFQNRLDADGRNPLINVNLDPLRPLSNLLWGYIQDEINRLTIQRRVYEYDHHYGLTLYGKAVQPLKSADSRSKFIEAYHHLLNRAWKFYKQEDDLTVKADPFPVLQALKEVHMLLAEGAHNQFGDLPWTARVEMLVQQWLLGRPEIGQFLNSRPMVPYAEGWMAQVDTLKKMFGWHDTSVTHFRDLGAYGEQILLSTRYANWTEINNPAVAAEWARYWRPEVQLYIYAYRTVTGVDLTLDPVNTTPPPLLLRDRLGAKVPAAV